MTVTKYGRAQVKILHTHPTSWGGETHDEYLNAGEHFELAAFGSVRITLDTGAGEGHTPFIRIDTTAAFLKPEETRIYSGGKGFA